MESRAKKTGHASHKTLIVFPSGLLPVALIFDLIGLFTKNNFWYEMTLYLIPVVLIGGAAHPSSV
jgi:uncharacterized membrane protein